MKWRSYRLGKLKITIGEKRNLHTGIGFKLGCGVDYISENIVIYWNGREKFLQITKLHETRLKL